MINCFRKEIPEYLLVYGEALPEIAVHVELKYEIGTFYENNVNFSQVTDQNDDNCTEAGNRKYLKTFSLAIDLKFTTFLLL